MKIGYVRVSTSEQNTLRQEVMMKELGVDEIYIDKMSGKNTNRPQLKAMLDYVRRGDTVIVSEISRFARNTKDLLDLVEKLHIKEVEFVSRKEAIDTTTPTGKFMLTIFGAVAELEREYILQRQREGIEIAKEQGKYKGRKKKVYTDFDTVIQKWRDKKITAAQAMKEMGMSKSTFYRRVKQEWVFVIYNMREWWYNYTITQGKFYALKLFIQIDERKTNEEKSYQFNFGVVYAIIIYSADDYNSNAPYSLIDIGAPITITEHGDSTQQWVGDSDNIELEAVDYTNQEVKVLVEYECTGLKCMIN